MKLSQTPWLWTWTASAATAQGMMFYVAWALGGSLISQFPETVGAVVVTGVLTLAVYLRWGNAVCFTSDADIFNFAGVALACALGAVGVLVGYALLIMALTPSIGPP